MPVFCPNCGFILEEVIEKGKRVLRCPMCGYTTENVVESGGLSITGTAYEGMKAVEEASGESGWTITKLIGGCPRCGHPYARCKIVQARRGDEPSTRFYECVKCGYRWCERD